MNTVTVESIKERISELASLYKLAINNMLNNKEYNNFEYMNNIMSEIKILEYKLDLVS